METSREVLEQQLRAAGVPLEEWGTGETKTLEHLLSEVRSGESVLLEVGGRLERHVRGAHVRVTHQGEVLVEDRQEFTDGRVRRRRLETSVGEKARPGESGEAAALRALEEELGIEGDDLTLTGHRRETKDVPSSSYPGLTSRYVTDRYDLELPTRHHRPEGYVEEQDDKRTVWVWVPQTGRDPSDR